MASNPAGPSALPKFTMEFQVATIDHLGMKLYSTLPPVIGELVSNAYDAESAKVEILIPEDPIRPTTEIVVRDFGHGMDAAGIQDEFLPIGRNRRGADSGNRMSKNRKVHVTGRKGLGKLSAFGVAVQMEVRSVVDGNAICLCIDYEELQEHGRTKPRMPYEPQIVVARTGVTKDPNGTEIRLRKLRRKTPMDADTIRKGLAKRLEFINIGFDVLVNGEPVRTGHRVQRSDCPAGFSWTIDETPDKGILDDGGKVSGWIGFHDQAAQGSERGIDIFANGKAVELGSYFNFRSTHAQYARAYLVGMVTASFLDGDVDLASTARTSVVWESGEAQALERWGRGLLAWAFDQWVLLRRKKKHDEVIVAAGFDKWLAARSESEKRVANKMVKLLVDDDDMSTARMTPLLEIVKNSVETAAFRDLVDQIEVEGGSAATLLKLFDDWKLIEAREYAKLVSGRMEALEKLNDLLSRDALEVRDMQPLFEEHPWLIDSSWTAVSGQATYTKLIRAHAAEPKNLPEEEKRLDIFGIQASGVVTIVEIKRPAKTLSRKDLEQIEGYVDWARTELVGTGKDALRYVQGLLIVGKISGEKHIADKQERLAGDDIRVQTYVDLYERGMEKYRAMEKELQKTAPEYVRNRKKPKPPQ